jgi:hypothetical protein
VVAAPIGHLPLDVAVVFADGEQRVDSRPNGWSTAGARVSRQS